MNNEDLNRAEKAVDKAQWKVDKYAERVKDYIREQKKNNAQATEEGWMDNVKNNVSDAWESTKDAAKSAWENTKNWVDDAWEDTKDAAEDAKAEIRKKTN